jgi:hypothetical protein
MKKGYYIKFGYGSKLLIPADFLVDRDQKIVDIFMGTDISEHMPQERIEQFIAAQTAQEVVK